MGFQTKYMDRENTNAKLMILVNKELKRDETGRKPFLTVGERMRSKTIRMLRNCKL